MSTTPHRLASWIYRSPRTPEMYLYLAEEDGFEPVPPDLLDRFGAPEFVMQLELHPGRPLARVAVTAVLQALAGPGYFLQMPPRLEPALYHGNPL